MSGDAAADADDPLPTDAELLARAARAGSPLFKVLQEPGPLRPLLAALAVLPAVLAGPRCGLHAVDPEWGLAALGAAAGETGPLDTPGGPAAWLTGLLVGRLGAGAAVPYFALSWAGTTLLVWAVWQFVAAALGPRPAAFAALLTAANPAVVGAAAVAPPASLGVALGVVAAWVWVTGLVEPGARGRPAGFGRSAAAGALAGAAAVVGGWAAAAGPVAVAACGLFFPLFGRNGGRAGAAAGFAAGLAPPLGLRLLAAGPADAGADAPLAPAVLCGVAAYGLWAAARGRWVPALARAGVLGWTLAAAGATAAAWSPGGGVSTAEVLMLLVAAAVAAAVAFEAACRPAVPTRVVVLLTALPAAAAVALWVWDDDPVRTVWRGLFAAAAVAAAWGVWQTAAHGVPPVVRSRRLLIGAVLLLVAGGVRAAVRAASADPGRDERRFVAALSPDSGNGGAAEVLLLAEPPEQAAARFLAAVAAPGRPVTVYAPDRPRVADAVSAAVAAGGGTTVAAVGGTATAWAASLFPGQSVTLAPAGAVRGRPARVARFPAPVGR